MALDLFAGAGGPTLGFERADLGFEPVYGQGQHAVSGQDQRLVGGLGA